jgi:hypothetical protein
LARHSRGRGLGLLGRAIIFFLVLAGVTFIVYGFYKTSGTYKASATYVKQGGGYSVERVVVEGRSKRIGGKYTVYLSYGVEVTASKSTRLDVVRERARAVVRATCPWVKYSIGKPREVEESSFKVKYSVPIRVEIPEYQVLVKPGRTFNATIPVRGCVFLTEPLVPTVVLKPVGSGWSIIIRDVEAVIIG